MIIEKTTLAQVDKVYAACIGRVDGETVFFGASEGPGECVCAAKGGIDTVWTQPGGTMNLVPIPGRDGEFYGTQKFLPVFAAEECTLNYIKYEDGGWIVKEVMKTPYLHRFDLFMQDGEVWFIGSTLCGKKEFTQDWSSPGAVYTGRVQKDPAQAFPLKKLYEGITKNHGFCKEEADGAVRYLVTGVEGIFAFEVPGRPWDEEWKIKKIYDGEVSDIAVCDIDGDGRAEYASIEPFHGSKAVIYKEVDGTLSPVKEYEIDFGHVIWGGTVNGTPVFILGYRRQDMRLLMIYYDGDFKEETIDSETGPSQISVLSGEKESFLLSANRQINELALYKISIDK
ncbi:hypothetical protein GPL15_20835 [Clostridium sp. MCC353]|uniref:hypothetical protein n=1 Tax=Clostridium sp. MCC353 TaxID=2592646 RepID=UPI001C01DBAA|nr:hypothetical protein [Clostridium sp. MCC353]MBT9778925.1 hypothetical protein [Clostridium sp. MCC353]